MKCFSWVVAAAFVVLAAHAQESGPGGPVRGQASWIETYVPCMDSAGAQLAHARRLKGRLEGKEGEELAFWRALAVEAYQAVRVFHPTARSTASEAAFRAGELLRAAGEDEHALEEFRWSAGHGEGTAFRARARLEIGHLLRRRERWREASEAYLDVAADAAAQAAHREDAWIWAGIVWKAQGRLEEARAAWRRVAEQGTEALARILAFDELCCSLLAEGDLEGAAGLLDECLARLMSRALEESHEGERVRNALLRMRVVDELQRAIARRKDSSAPQGSSRKS